MSLRRRSVAGPLVSCSGRRYFPTLSPRTSLSLGRIRVCWVCSWRSRGGGDAKGVPHGKVEAIGEEGRGDVVRASVCEPELGQGCTRSSREATSRDRILMLVMSHAAGHTAGRAQKRARNWSSRHHIKQRGCREGEHRWWWQLQEKTGMGGQCCSLVPTAEAGGL